MKKPLPNPIQIAHAEGRTAWMVGYDEALDGPYGYVLVDDKRIEIENLDALFTKGQWTFDAEPIDKARQRKFESRSEAARYAARVRWGTRGDEASSSAGGTAEQYGLVQEPTNDPQRVLDGEPYARMLDISPDIVAELESAVDEVKEQDYDRLIESPKVAAVQERLRQHYATALTHPDAPPWNATAEKATGRKTPEEFAADLADRKVRAEWVSHRNRSEHPVNEHAFIDTIRGDKKADIVVSVDSDGLTGIVQDRRIKTQFETGTSGGWIGGGATAHSKRATTEAINFGFHPSADPQKRPVYGSLMPRGAVDSDVNLSYQYGGIYLVMKPQVRSRTTFSAQDSLGRGQIQYPLNGSGQARPKTVNWTGSRFQEQAFSTPKGKEVEPHAYVETQIHGGVRLGNISKVVVHRAYTLNDSVLKELAEVGIPVEFTEGDRVAKRTVEKAMRKLVATGNGWWLYQTGFDTVYEGSYAEETFPSGYAEDANGNQTPVRNLLSALEKGNWTLVELPDMPIEKGRERKFQSRSEAARYAAHIRWGTRPTEQSGERTIASNGVPLEPTWDVNEAILTGRPYAPFLEENYPPEVKEALTAPVKDSFAAEPTDEQKEIVQSYFRSHLEPNSYSEEVRTQMLAVRGTTATAQLTGDQPKQHYEGLAQTTYSTASIYAFELRQEAFRKAAADKFGEKYLDDAMTVTKEFQASPTKAISISVDSASLLAIDRSGTVGNQFGTGTSNGFLSLQRRASHEAISYGVHPATLPQKRPVYGTYHAAGVRHSHASGSDQYGDVQLVLKPEVHKRATFTMQDSLGMVRTATPLEGEITRPQIFPNLSLGKSSTSHPLNLMRRIRSGKPHEYQEAQIHGGMKLSDVSHIVFNASYRHPKPPANVVRFARKRGLKIIVAEMPTVKEPFGVITLDGPEVQKAFDAIVAELTDVIFKAKSFNGDRSAAAQYAARVRWGNRSTEGSGYTPPPMPDGWEPDTEFWREKPNGEGFYVFIGPQDNGGVLQAAHRVGEGGGTVELRRVGGPNSRKLGEITYGVGLTANTATPPNTFAVDFISVHADERRKGYATLMLQIARAKAFKGYEIRHSTVLTDDGAAFAAATKSFDDVEKGRPRKFQTRSEAARYAAQIRWGNRGADATGGLPPHMQAMKDEAESIRAELSEIVADMHLERLQRSSPRYRKSSWTDDKGAVQIDTNSEEMIPSPRLADAHDRVIALGSKMLTEANDRSLAAHMKDPSTPLEVHQAKAFQDVVSEIVPIGGTPKFAAIAGLSTEAKEIETALLEATSKMPTSWVDASAQRDLYVNVGTSYPNPFFRGLRSGYEEICFPPPAQIKREYGKVMARSTAHEFTHMVEHRVPAIKALEIAFMTSRTTGFSLATPYTPLRSRMTSTLRDRRSQATMQSQKTPTIDISQDSFRNLYSGRHYDQNTRFDRKAVYADTPNNDRSHTRSAFEVLTTGVEMYVDGNTDNFDSNHMAFVLGTLVTT